MSVLALIFFAWIEGLSVGGKEICAPEMFQCCFIYEDDASIAAI